MKRLLATIAALAILAMVEVAVAETAINKSEAMQAGRLKLMEKLKNERVFQKVEIPGTLPRLFVQPRFYTLDFDMKQKFVSVVYAYYFDGSKSTDSVRIYDSRSGKEIGYYAVPQGLKLD